MGVFVILVLTSGMLAKLCKGEVSDGPSKLGFWIFDKSSFTKRGQTLRVYFFLASNLSILAFFAVLIAQEQFY